MTTHKKPSKNNAGRDEAAPALDEAPTRVTRVSRQRMRDEVFRHDWNSISDAERAARLAAIAATAMPEGPTVGPAR